MMEFRVVAKRTNNILVTVKIHDDVNKPVNQDSIKTYLKNFYQDCFYDMPGSFRVVSMDDCYLCNKPLQRMTDGSPYTHCHNKDCDNGAPDQNEFRALYHEHPFGRDEPASAYIDRITQLWRGGK